MWRYKPRMTLFMLTSQHPACFGCNHRQPTESPSRIRSQAHGLEVRTNGRPGLRDRHWPRIPRRGEEYPIQAQARALHENLWITSGQGQSDCEYHLQWTSEKLNLKFSILKLLHALLETEQKLTWRQIVENWFSLSKATWSISAKWPFTYKPRV